MFVKKNEVAEVRKRLRRFKQFKELTTSLVEAYVELGREEGFNNERPEE